MSIYDGLHTAEAVLHALHQAGSEKAATHINKSIKNEMNIDSGAISLYRSTENISIAATSLIGSKKGFVIGNDIQSEAITKQAEQAAVLARASEKDSGNDIAPEQAPESLTVGTTEPDNEKMYERLTEFLDHVRSQYPTLQLNQCILDFTQSESIYANSNKVQFKKNTGSYHFAAMFFAKDKNGTGSFNYGGAEHLNLDVPLKDWGGLDALMRQSCEQTKTKPLTGSFKGDIIITPTALSEFVWIIVQSFMSDTPLIAGTSLWKDKLQQAVCSSLITLRAKPCKPEAEIERLYTQDGFRIANSTLIEHGILKDFALSLYGAKKTGLSRCVSGAASLCIEAGTTARADMIKHVKRGILLGRFSGGRPAANGDFSGVAKNSYLIENGSIICPLSETMIAGNLAALLERITAVSQETIDYGTARMPWLQGTGITISGK